MVIELYGLPGAGKTRLASLISESLNVPTVRISTIPKRLWWWFRQLVRYPLSIIWAEVAVYANAKTSQELLSFTLNAYIDRYAKFSLARVRGGVVDEGPMQNTLSYPHRVLTKEEMHVFVSRLPRPTVLVILNVPKDVRQKRQEERGRIVRNTEWESYAEENFQTAQAIVQKMGIPTIVTDGNNTDELVSQLTQYAHKY